MAMLMVLNPLGDTGRTAASYYQLSQCKILYSSTN